MFKAAVGDRVVGNNAVIITVGNIVVNNNVMFKTGCDTVGNNCNVVLVTVGDDVGNVKVGQRMDGAGLCGNHSAIVFKKAMLGAAEMVVSNAVIALSSCEDVMLDKKKLVTSKIIAKMIVVCCCK
jgi:uncharacterized protein GlcG (DUF336 family)